MEIPHLKSMISQAVTDYHKFCKSCSHIASLANEYIQLAHEGRDDVTELEISCDFLKGDGLVLEVSYYEYSYGYREMIVPVDSFFKLIKDEKFKFKEIEVEQLHKIAI